VLFDELEEVRYSLEESHRFYNELIQLLMDFQSKILDFCLAREDDWKELARSLAASTTHSLENRSRVNSGIITNLKPQSNIMYNFKSILQL